MIKVLKKVWNLLEDSWLLNTKIGFMIASTIGFVLVAFLCYSLCFLFFGTETAVAVAAGILCWLPVNYLMTSCSTLNWFTKIKYS